MVKKFLDVSNCGCPQTSDPAGAIVLERCRVLKDSSPQKKHGFTIGKFYLLKIKYDMYIYTQ